MRSTIVITFALAISSVATWRHFSSKETCRDILHDEDKASSDESDDSDRAVTVSSRLYAPPPLQSATARAPLVEENAVAVAAPVAKPPSKAEQAAIVERALIEAYPESATLRFDEAMERQPTNRAWSAEVTDAAMRLLRSNTSEGTQLSSVDCRQTICRIRVNHRDIEAEKAFWHSTFTADGPWSDHLQGGPSRSSGDALSSFIYFANEEGAQQFVQIDAQITEDTEFAITQALEERGLTADNS